MPRIAPTGELRIPEFGHNWTQEGAFAWSNFHPFGATHRYVMGVFLRNVLSRQAQGSITNVCVHETTGECDVQIHRREGNKEGTFSMQMGCTTGGDNKQYGATHSYLSLQGRLPFDPSHASLQDSCIVQWMAFHACFREMHMNGIIEAIGKQVSMGSSLVAGNLRCLFIDERRAKAILVFSDSYTAVYGRVSTGYLRRENMSDIVATGNIHEQNHLLENAVLSNFGAHLAGHVCGINYHMSYLPKTSDAVIEIFQAYGSDFADHKWTITLPRQDESLLLRTMSNTVSYTTEEVEAYIKQVADEFSAQK